MLGNLPSDIVALPEQVSANLALPSGESLVRHVGHKRIELRSKHPILFSEQLAHRQQFFQFNREKAESLRKSLGDVLFLNIYTGHLFGHQLPDLIAISEDLIIISVIEVSGLSIRPELTIWSKGTQSRQCGWRKGRAIFEAPIKFRFYPLKEPLVVAVSPSSSVSLPTGLQGTTGRMFTICCSIHPEGR